MIDLIAILIIVAFVAIGYILMDRLDRYLSGTSGKRDR